MKAEVLLDPLGEIDDRFLEDDEVTTPVKRFGWVKWAAVAACLVVAAAITIPMLNSKTPATEDQPTKTEQPDETQTQQVVTVPENLITDVYGGGGWDGTGRWSHGFTDYYEFSPVVEEPVFEAFANSEVGQQHELSYLVAGTMELHVTGRTYEITEVSMKIDWEVVEMGHSPRWRGSHSSVSVSHYYYSTYDEYLSGDGLYERAEPYGVVTTFEVNGHTVQEVDYTEYLIEALTAIGDQTMLEIEKRHAESGHFYNARVEIDGVWYHLSGHDETCVHDMAVALAEVAG